MNNGFITRIEALNNLVSNNNSVAYRYYLLVAILMLIELMPVIAKTLLPDGSYDEKVRLREALEKELTRKNHERELALKELHNQSAFEQDTQFIKDALTEADTERRKKMKEQLTAWQTSNNGALNTTWQEMKRDTFLEPEN